MFQHRNPLTCWSYSYLHNPPFFLPCSHLFYMRSGLYLVCTYTTMHRQIVELFVTFDETASDDNKATCRCTLSYRSTIQTSILEFVVGHQGRQVQAQHSTLLPV
jgi:hypothetical protein